MAGLNKRGDTRGMHGNHPTGEHNHNWTGGRTADSYGYIQVRMPDHPRASVRGYVREHVLIVERALGHPLPLRAVVHHADRDPANNERANLVACEDQAYHRLIHRRQRAYEACGHADWLSCRWCGVHEGPANLVVWKNGKAAHRDCERERSRPFKQAYKQRARGHG